LDVSREIGVLEVGRNLLLVSSSSAIGLGCVAAFWLMGALIASKDVVGQISFVISVSTVFSGTAQLGFGLGKLAIFPKDNRGKILLQFDAIVGLVSMAAIAALWGLKLNLVTYGPIVLGQVSFSMVTYDLLARKEYATASLLTIVCRTLQLAVGLASLWAGHSPETIALAYAAPLLITSPVFGRSVFGGLKLRKRPNLRMDGNLLGNLSGIAVLRTLIGYLDKVIVAFVLGYVVLGEYQFVFQVFLLAQFFPSSVLLYLVPERSSGSIGKSLLAIPMLGAFGTAVLAIVVASVALNTFLPAYSNTLMALVVVSTTIIPATAASFLASELMTSGGTKSLLRSYLLSFCSQYLALLTLTAVAGLEGVAGSLLVGQTVLLMASGFAVKNARKKKARDLSMQEQI